jgi:hypothetical protein
MKKTIRKLVVRSETLRALRALDNRDLIHAVGGAEYLVRESRNTCPTPAVVAAPIGGG